MIFEKSAFKCLCYQDLWTKSSITVGDRVQIYHLPYVVVGLEEPFKQILTSPAEMTQKLEFWEMNTNLAHVQKSKINV